MLFSQNIFSTVNFRYYYTLYVMYTTHNPEWKSQKFLLYLPIQRLTFSENCALGSVFEILIKLNFVCDVNRSHYEFIEMLNRRKKSII